MYMIFVITVVILLLQIVLTTSKLFRLLTSNRCEERYNINNEQIMVCSYLGCGNATCQNVKVFIGFYVGISVHRLSSVPVHHLYLLPSIKILFPLLFFAWQNISKLYPLKVDTLDSPLFTPPLP